MRNLVGANTLYENDFVRHIIAQTFLNETCMAKIKTRVPEPYHFITVIKAKSKLDFEMIPVMTFS